MLGSSCQREKSLVTVAPLLHPTVDAFGDSVGGLLGGNLRAVHSVQTVTEGNAIVIDAQDEVYIGTQRGRIFAAKVLALATLAREHCVFVSDRLYEIEIGSRAAVVTKLFHCKNLLIFVSDDVLARIGKQGDVVVGRGTNIVFLAATRHCQNADNECGNNAKSV